MDDPRGSINDARILLARTPGDDYLSLMRLTSPRTPAEAPPTESTRGMVFACTTGTTSSMHPRDWWCVWAEIAYGFLHLLQHHTVVVLRVGLVDVPLMLAVVRGLCVAASRQVSDSSTGASLMGEGAAPSRRCRPPP